MLLLSTLLLLDGCSLAAHDGPNESLLPSLETEPSAAAAVPAGEEGSASNILFEEDLGGGLKAQVTDYNALLIFGGDITINIKENRVLASYISKVTAIEIGEGVRFIKAKGHTKGNSIIVVEMDGLFYMLHGDITYVDEALYEDKLSVVFDDLAAARETQDRIREFVRNHPTVYCGTHTPQGYENLEAKRVIDLDNPVPTVFAEIDFSLQEASGKYVCSVCGYVYDPAEHDGVAFEDLPDDWRCPRCKQPKTKFNKA